MFTEEFLASSKDCGKYELLSYKTFTVEEHFLQIFNDFSRLNLTNVSFLFNTTFMLSGRNYVEYK
jgi:hypothetical protein